MLEKYIRLSLIYQWKGGCDTSIQNVILTEMINLMATTIVDIDIEIKMKIRRIKYLEIRLLWLCSFILIELTVICVTEYKTRCYWVFFQNNGCIRVQKFEVFADDENNIYWVKPLEAFLGKSEVCDMTLMSGAFDKSVFDGNTFLFIIINDENNKRRYVYVGGNMICSFLTKDKLQKTSHIW